MGKVSSPFLIGLAGGLAGPVMCWRIFAKDAILANERLLYQFLCWNNGNSLQAVGLSRLSTFLRVCTTLLLKFQYRFWPYKYLSSSCKIDIESTFWFRTFKNQMKLRFDCIITNYFFFSQLLTRKQKNYQMFMAQMLSHVNPIPRRLCRTNIFRKYL